MNKQIRQRLIVYFRPTYAETIQTDMSVQDLLLNGRERIFTSVLRFTSLFIIFALLSTLPNLISKSLWGLVIFYTLFSATVYIFSIFRHIHLFLRILSFMTLLYVGGVIDLCYFGIGEDWRLYFTGLSVTAVLFIGWRAGMFSIGLSILSYTVVAWLISNGLIVPSATMMAIQIPSIENIITTNLIFLIVNAGIVTAVDALLHEYHLVSQKERTTAQSLCLQTAELEESLNREQHLATELKSALDREEELSQLKSRIIATVSHEFRTPLTVIKNASDLLKRHHISLSEEKRNKYHKWIDESIFYLTELLQDASLIESANTQKLAMRKKVMLFGDFCHRVQNDLESESYSSFNIHCQIQGNPHTTILIDYDIVRQVINNLLTNAQKFSSSEDTITLKLALMDQLTIAVMDQGIGIPTAELDRVWELFYRGSNVVTTQRGLGLGLYIVRQLVEMMNGTVTAVSPYPTAGKKGSAFIVTLDVVQERKAEPMVV